METYTVHAKKSLPLYPKVLVNTKCFACWTNSREYSTEKEKKYRSASGTQLTTYRAVLKGWSLCQSRPENFILPTTDCAKQGSL